MFRDRSRKTYKDGEIDARGDIPGKSLHLWPEHARPATEITAATEPSIDDGRQSESG
jgi:hypothetical protein